MESKIGMCHQSHGVAEVDFGDMDVPFRVADAVYTQWAMVVWHNDVLQPRFQQVTLSRGESHQKSNGVVGLQAVAPIDPIDSFEKRKTEKGERAVLHTVLQGEVVLHRPTRLGDGAALLLNHLVEPVLVVVAKRMRHPSKPPTRPRPGRLKHHIGVLRQQCLYLGNRGHGMTVRLKGQKGGAMLQLPPQVEEAVGRHQMLGDALFEQALFEHSIPAPWHQLAVAGAPIHIAHMGSGDTHGHRIETAHQPTRRSSKRQRGGWRHIVPAAIGEAKVVLGIEDANHVRSK